MGCPAFCWVGLGRESGGPGERSDCQGMEQDAAAQHLLWDKATGVGG